LRYLPNFNETEVKIEQLEIVGYNIEGNTVEYYDGTSWINIDEGQEIWFEDKLIKGKDLASDFKERYYYKVKQDISQVQLGAAVINHLTRIDDDDIRGGKKSIFHSKPPQNIKNLESFFVYSRAMTNEELKDGSKFIRFPTLASRISDLIDEKESKEFRGAVSLFIVPSRLLDEDYDLLGSDFAENIKFYRRFVVTQDGDLYFSKSTSEFGSQIREIAEGGQYENVVDLATLWRDSIFNEPINIRYFDSKGKDKNDWYCPEKIGSGFLVRLDRPLLDYSEDKDVECGT